MWPVVLWWLALEGLGLLALPLTFRLFAPTSAYGYPFGKILLLLLLTYAAWLAGYVVPMPVAVYGTLAALIAAAVFLAWRQREPLVGWLRSGGWRTILFHDLLFTAGFLFFAWHRSVNPNIVDQEKFMDFAFFNLLARTDTMPPQDPWMSGHTINYYYFGYLMFATLARMIPLPTYISYNLCVATIGGLAFSQTAAVVIQLTRRWGLGLLGGCTAVIFGNLDGFLQFLEKRTLLGMDVWRSSRIVGRFLDPKHEATTINEFPFFTTIHGDLHGHFMALIVSIAMVGILLDERLFPSRAEDQPAGTARSLAPFVVLAFVFGALVAVSTWELPMGAVVITLLAGRWQPLFPLLTKARLQLAARIAGVLAGTYVLFLPFYLAFTKPPGGGAVKFAESALSEFLTMFGFMLFAPALLVGLRAWSRLPSGGEWRQLLAASAGLLLLIAALAGNGVFPLLVILLAAALFVAYANADEDERGPFLLIAAATIALLACETVYLKDAYGDRLYRMNTVFKLYFQAWTLLAVAGPWCIGRLMAQRWSWAPMHRIVATTIGFGIAASACYPIGVTLDRMSRPSTLNGNQYLSVEHPDDFAAITWLRQNVRDLPVILEATGGAYSYFARFSSNTGLPTVMGWDNHEGLWRGHDTEVGKRRDDVNRIYNAPTIESIQSLLDQYQVRYIVVGELERKHHAAGLQKFAALQVAFRQGGTTLYQR